MRWMVCWVMSVALGACAMGGDRRGTTADLDGGEVRGPGADAGADAQSEPVASDAGADAAADARAPVDAPDGGSVTCEHRVCGGECVDLRLDPRHCGDCDAACGAGELCDEGACHVGPVEAWRVDYGLGRPATPGAEQLSDLAVDPSGRPYVVGRGRAPRYLTPDAVAGGFVEGLDRAGRSRLLHVTPMFEGTSALPLAVAVGADDRYYVVGSVTGPYVFDATHSAPSEAHAYVAGYDPDGTMRWLQASSTTPRPQIDLRAGELYTALRHQDRPYELGGVRLISEDHSGYDIYTVAMTTDGAVRWGRGALGSGTGLAAAPDHVVRAGFESIATGGGFFTQRHALEVYDRDGDPLPGYRALNDHGGARSTAVAEGGGVVYLAVLGTDDAGWVIQRYVDRNLEWERQLGAAIALSDITVDDAGRVYASGVVRDGVSFDGVSRGAEDEGFVVALDATGATRWSWFHAPPADSLNTRIREVEVSGALVYVWLEYSRYGGARVLALRQG